MKGCDEAIRRSGGLLLQRSDRGLSVRRLDDVREH
jgi:hypothetical protein